MAFNIIGEMTKEELIEEILANQRETLESHDIGNLKGLVVNMRLESVKQRLIEEAGLKVTPGLFGGIMEEKDGEGS